jgi:hypothetical protein
MLAGSPSVLRMNSRRRFLLSRMVASTHVGDERHDTGGRQHLIGQHLDQSIAEIRAEVDHIALADFARRHRGLPSVKRLAQLPITSVPGATLSGNRSIFDDMDR